MGTLDGAIAPILPLEGVWAVIGQFPKVLQVLSVGVGAVAVKIDILLFFLSFPFFSFPFVSFRFVPFRFVPFCSVSFQSTRCM